MKNKSKTAFFSFKNDDKDLVELGEFIRCSTKYRVEREWHLTFDNDGKLRGYSKTIPEDSHYHSRNPDLILIDKKTHKLRLIIELDGDIHRIDETKTNNRNADYDRALLPYLVINTWEIETSIFDHVSHKLERALI